MNDALPSCPFGIDLYFLSAFVTFDELKVTKALFLSDAMSYCTEKMATSLSPIAYPYSAFFYFGFYEYRPSRSPTNRI